jgi:hypothetical protein
VRRQLPGAADLHDRLVVDLESTATPSRKLGSWRARSPALTRRPGLAVATYLLLRFHSSATTWATTPHRQPRIRLGFSGNRRLACRPPLASAGPLRIALARSALQEQSKLRS